MAHQLRLRHTAIRVRDIDTSIAFYTKYLGMSVTRRRESKPRAHYAAYLAYGDEASHHAIELVQDFTPPDEFQMGNLYWHLNFSLPNMMDICARMKENGVAFVEEPTPMSMDARYHVAFLKDPDGYEVELTDFP